MADICCDVAGKAEPPVAPCERSTRVARRRRMVIRRFKFVAGVEAVDPAEEAPRKRQRLSCSALVPLDLENAVASESEPRRACEQEDADFRTSRYGVMSVCGRRKEMEDSVFVLPDFARRTCGSFGGSHHFFGVYDGHGCSHVAALCGGRMHEFVADEMSSLGSVPPTPEAWTGLMERSFLRMDSAAAEALQGGRPTLCCRCELHAPRCDNVGSTAVVAVVGPTRIVVANCGDSRAVLCRGGAPSPLSSDHKPDVLLLFWALQPDRPDELSRIEAAGGRVIYWEGARVLGVLAMSRAIGTVLQPEVTVTERRDDDEFLILGSDGLWDVVTNEMACDVVRTCLRAKGLVNEPIGEEEVSRDGGCSDRACSAAAALLTKLALARQSADNVSVVVVDLKRCRSW
ncbi:hypothetical protein B296_00029999 [Ensete ventricosum]|uniref:protein-serine/threonine phosphatase n=1 Tax=Ensete ventricosum TaxID=4639 RepID=A0A426ZGV8_ENSVE|nr:hypothetical protein B296_00029999 [Ensete ventricosum]